MFTLIANDCEGEDATFIGIFSSREKADEYRCKLQSTFDTYNLYESDVDVGFCTNSDWPRCTYIMELENERLQLRNKQKEARQICDQIIASKNAEVKEAIHELILQYSNCCSELISNNLSNSSNVIWFDMCSIGDNLTASELKVFADFFESFDITPFTTNDNYL